MPEPKPAVEKTVRITLVRSPIGYSKRHKPTVRALGLRRMHQTVEQVDTPTTAWHAGDGRSPGRD